MRRRWVVLVLLTLTACAQPAGNGNPAAHVSSPTPSVAPGGTSQSPSASSSATTSPTASPTLETSPIPDLPVSPLGFSCRLPIYTYGAYPAIDDAFIDFPSGKVTADPHGNKGMYYDLAFRRWVPVPRTAVSPDGTRYAFVDPRQSQEIVIHTVDLATGADHAVHLSDSATGLSASGVDVFDYSPEGVYLVQGFEHIWPGVWLYNPRTGTVSKVANIEVPELSAGSGVFWYGAVNQADPSPVNTLSSAGILPDEVDRLNLRTGSSARWLFRPGVALSVLGVDALGRPLIEALFPTGGNVSGSDFYKHAQSELLLGLGTTSQRSIYKGQIVETLASPIADSHGVWFGGSQGIYLYTDAGGLQKVSDHAGVPANGCF